jgi:hypothetical protein
MKSIKANTINFKRKTKTDMKKQVIMALAFALTGLGVQAQTDTNARRSLEIQIEENTITFDPGEKDLSQADLATMIGFATREVGKMQAKQQQIMAKIDKLEAEGKLSEAEADELRDKAEDNFEEGMDHFEEVMERWGEAYGERMASWAEKFAEGMEAWGEQVERDLENDSTMATPPPPPPVPPLPNMGGEDSDSTEADPVKKRIVISKDGVILKDQDEEVAEEETEIRFKDLFDEGKRKKSKKINRTESYFDIGFGFNQQLEDGQYLVEDIAGQLNFWRSRSFNLGYGAKSRIGNPYSKVYIKYGIDFSWHNFQLEGNEVLVNNGTAAVFDTIATNLGYEKNKYHIAYFNVPVMLQLDFSDAGKRDDAFTLGVGGYAGIRLLAKTESEYNTAQYRKVETKTYDDFYTQRFRYGVMAQVGFDSFKINASYDLNEFFRAGKGPAYNMVNVGVSWTL